MNASAGSLRAVFAWDFISDWNHMFDSGAHGALESFCSIN